MVSKSSEEKVLLILGGAQQVRYPTSFENIEKFDVWAISSELVEELMEILSEFAEQMEQEGEEAKCLTMLIKCVELARRLDVTAQGQKMVAFARLRNTLEYCFKGSSRPKWKIPAETMLQLSRAKHTLYYTLTF
ncbi:uncharacterized protein [Watersipora subatra]|uniref:uncharacterized protein n=1 Tax=Watersipora subatra TaxID=2589382 RepID=UPI00355C04E4